MVKKKKSISSSKFTRLSGKRSVNHKMFDRLFKYFKMKANERRYNLVYRKQGYFCNRCGARVEKMYEQKLIRFTEDHTCTPQDVLQNKVKRMNRGW